MTLRVIIYRLGVIPLLLLLCILAACSQQDLDQEEQGMVSLKVLASPGTKAGEGGTATATLPAKETAIFDLSIFIFNSNGDVIGFTSQDFSDGKPTAVVVKTRKATGCSVYAIANAKTLNKNGTSPFDGVSTLSVFKAKFLSFPDAKAPNNANCLLMMGVSSDFDTSSASSASPATITLKRLASRIDYTIAVNNDQTTGFPIVVDSYQLRNVPTSTLYQQSDFTSPSMPSSPTFADLDKVSTSISSVAAPTSAGTYYVYANNGTFKDNGTSKETYLDIQAHSEVRGTDGTKYTVWKSNFRVNMPGNHVLPNYHYKIDIVINGSVNGKDGGVITTYEAYPYFSGSILNPWGPNENKDLDLQ